MVDNVDIQVQPLFQKCNKINNDWRRLCPLKFEARILKL